MNLILKLQRVREIISDGFPLNKKALQTGSNLELRKYLLNFLDYMENNPTTTYYPISRISEASSCNSASHLVEIAGFMSSSDIGILTIQYCYYPNDGDDFIQISAQNFRDAKFNGEPPVDMSTGEEYLDYKTESLGFVCYLKEGN